MAPRIIIILDYLSGGEETGEFPVYSNIIVVPKSLFIEIYDNSHTKIQKFYL